jgi:hypothetical protein
MFLVPKPGVNKWRLIIDLRKLNSYYVEFNMSCETLKHLRHLSSPGDYFVSLDLADGYYTVHTRYPRGRHRLRHGKQHGRPLAPRVPPDELIRVRLLLL